MIDTNSEHISFGGVQGFYTHDSGVIGLPMRFSVYQPPQAKLGKVPALFFLAGLTATEETFVVKAGAQRVAAELGIALISCDTSPRNTGIAGATQDWDFGEGAGFYLDATMAPWHQRFQMERYLVEELRGLMLSHFPIEADQIGIFGHSMGGHGALTLALRHPDIFRSVSAFAPIVAPTQCAWGKKAFSRYLGADQGAWQEHDACALIRKHGARFAKGILIDQGLSDKFLAESQLQPELFEAACQVVNQPLTLRRHEGYDHGYYFVSTFVAAHLTFHHAQLCGR
jgi:S-formylglutathione hydrolase